MGMRPAAALDHELNRIKTRFPGLGSVQPFDRFPLYLFGVRVDGLDAVADAQIDPLRLPEDLGPAHRQLVEMPTAVGDGIQHAAGASGNIVSLFQHDDIDVRCIAFNPAGRAHAGGITADHHKSHV